MHLEIFVRVSARVSEEAGARCLSSLCISLAAWRKAQPTLDGGLTLIGESASAFSSALEAVLRSHAPVPHRFVASEAGEMLGASFRQAQFSPAQFFYFTATDTLHDESCLGELLAAQKEFSKNLGGEVAVTPTDLALLYEAEGLLPTRVVAGEFRHWRTVPFTGGSFLLSGALFSAHAPRLLEFTPWIVHGNSTEESLALNARVQVPLFGPLPALAANISTPDKRPPFSRGQVWWDEKAAGAPSPPRRSPPPASVELITIANEEARGMRRLVESCRRFGVSLKVLGWGQPFPGLFWKAKVIRRWLESGNHAKHFLFLDAYDTLLLDGLDEIFARYREFGAPLVLSAETNCHPHPARALDYPACDTPFRFVNSGAYLAEASFLKEALARLPVEQTSSLDDDQGLFTDLFLRMPGRVALDSHCRIFQSIDHAEFHLCARDGRVFNRTTETSPSILHFNGKAETARVLSWLESPAPPVPWIKPVFTETFPHLHPRA